MNRMGSCYSKGRKSNSVEVDVRIKDSSGSGSGGGSETTRRSKSRRKKSRGKEIIEIPGRMCINASSKIACLHTQQGKKGTNQDAMLLWEVRFIYLFTLFTLSIPNLNTQLVFYRISVREVIQYFVGYLTVMVLSVTWWLRKSAILSLSYYLLSGKQGPITLKKLMMMMIMNGVISHWRPMMTKTKTITNSHSQTCIYLLNIPS